MKYRCLIPFLLCLLLSGCAVGDGAEAPLPTPSPSPRPGVAAILPREKTSLAAGLSEDRIHDHAIFETAAGGPERAYDLDPAGDCVLICCIEGGDNLSPLRALAAAGVPILLYSETGAALPEGFSGLSYDASAAVDTALEQALHHEAHEAPVRLFGLFAGPDSPGARAYGAAEAAGQILDRGSYHPADGEGPEAAEQWLNRQLKQILPGMADGIFAETAELALAAARAVEAAGYDNLEVFSADADDGLLAYMQAHPSILPAAVGPDELFAGQYLRAQAGRLLLHLPAGERAVLLPVLYRAAELSGGEGVLETMGHARVEAE